MIFLRKSLTAFTMFLFAGFGWTQTPNYCTPSSDCDYVYNNHDVWGNVQLSITDVHFDHQISNDSPYNPDQCINNGYQDFSAIRAKVNPGETYELIVYGDAWSHVNNSFHTYYCFYWIDWNQDGVFDESEQQPLVIDATETLGTFKITFEGDVTVPPTATIGDTRMRIRIYDIENDTLPPGPCAHSHSGEVEDYTLEVTNGDVPPRDEYCAAAGRFNCIGRTESGITTQYVRQYIDTVIIPGEVNSGLVNSSSFMDCVNARAYSDYTDLVPTPIWLPLEEYNVHIHRFDSNTTYGMCGMFIDWNEDFDFDDPGETYIDVRYGGAGLTDPFSSPRQHDFAVQVPPGFNNGFKRVRFRITSALSGEPQPCGDHYVQGEVEDYKIWYSADGSPPPPPPPPPFLACAENPVPNHGTSGICQGTELTLQWSPPSFGDPATGYKLYLGTDNPPTNMENGLDMGDQLSYQFNVPLQTNTNYYWQVVPYNDNGDANNPCQVWIFNTAPMPDPVATAHIQQQVIDTTRLCPYDYGVMGVTVSQGNGGLTYQWSSENMQYAQGTGTDDTLGYFANMADTSLFYIRVTDIYGCSDLDSLTVITKKNAEGGEITGLNAVCDGERIRFQLENYDGNIQWQRRNPLNGNWGNLHGLTQDTLGLPPVVGSIGYRAVLERNGCYDTSGVRIATFYAIPPKPVISSDLGTVLCQGETATLSSSYSTGNVWSTGETTSSIQVNQSGTVTLQYTDEHGCQPAEVSIPISVHPVPGKPRIVADGGKTAFCKGDETTLRVTSSETGFLYWNNNPFITGETYQPKNSGQFYVTLSNSWGCEAQSNSISITVYPLPPIPEISRSGDTLFSSVPVGNQWYNAIAAIPGATARFYLPPSDGLYHVEVRSDEGCTNLSDPFAFQTTGLEVWNPEGPEIRLFPNPLHIGDILEVSGPSGMELQVISPLGKTIYRGNHPRIATRQWAPGIYMVRGKKERTGEWRHLGKIMVVR